MPTFGYYLNALGRCGGTFRSEQLAGTGVGGHDGAYLAYICRHPGESQDAIARALCVNKSHVTRHVSHLEKEGFLTRTPDPDDRRSMLVYPTARAEEILPRLREVGAAWRAILAEGFTEDDVAKFEELLARALRNGRSYLFEEDGK